MRIDFVVRNSYWKNNNLLLYKKIIERKKKMTLFLKIIFLSKKFVLFSLIFYVILVMILYFRCNLKNYFN